MKQLILSAAGLALFFMLSLTGQSGSQTDIHHGHMQLGVPAALAVHDKEQSRDKEQNKDKDRAKDKDHAKPDHHDRPSSPKAFRSIYGS